MMIPRYCIDILGLAQNQLWQLGLDLLAFALADLQPHITTVLRYPLAKLNCTELADLTRRKASENGLTDTNSSSAYSLLW